MLRERATRRRREAVPAVPLPVPTQAAGMGQLKMAVELAPERQNPSSKGRLLSVTPSTRQLTPAGPDATRTHVSACGRRRMSSKERCGVCEMLRLTSLAGPGHGIQVRFGARLAETLVDAGRSQRVCRHPIRALKAQHGTRGEVGKVASPTLAGGEGSGARPVCRRECRACGARSGPLSCRVRVGRAKDWCPRTLRALGARRATGTGFERSSTQQSPNRLTD